MTDDVFHIYVDFHRIAATNSPDDAVALTLAMFSIFELGFEKNGRTLRFLYAILYGDKRYLSNSTRNLVREKSINIYAEQSLVKLSSFPFNRKCLPSKNRSQSISLSATVSSDVKNDKPADLGTNLSGMTSQQSIDNNVKKYVR